MSPTDVLSRITASLTEAGAAYMLTGSFASAYYGASRSTQDIDLVIEATAEQLKNFVLGLPTGEYYADVSAALDALQRHSMFNVIDINSGWKIDLIIRKDRPFSREEFRRRRPVTLHGVSIFLASAEDVIISKLEWSKLAESQRQISDVARILQLRWQSLDRSYLGKWCAELKIENQWADARKAASL
jgi:hypothetical protein